MDILTWATALGALGLGATCYGLCAWGLGPLSLRRPSGPGASFGPMPGYAQYPGEALERLKVGLSGTDLHVESMETFHTPYRQRLVLTMERPHVTFEVFAEVMERSAQQVLAWTGADVVVVEVASDVDGPTLPEHGLLIVSQDGAGWSGQGRPGRVVVQAWPEAQENQTKEREHDQG